MEEFAQKVFDLPVLAQGIIGSFLFWLIYETAKLLVGIGVSILSKFNRRIRRELVQARIFHHAHSLADGPNTGAYYHTISLYIGANRAIHALIYLCIGLIAEQFVGRLSAIPFAISVGYLFLAMRAVHIDFSAGSTKEQHKEAFDKLIAEWDKLKIDGTSPNQNGR